MRAITPLARLAYRGVLIERPCAFCNTTDYHYDGMCHEGPCTVCGVSKHEGGFLTHPLPADGKWRGSYDQPMHDWTAHEYLPADIDQDLPAFEAIVDTARRLGMPESYTTDLYRDYQWIAEHPDAMFIWVLRPMGTHIVVGYHGWRGALDYMEHNEPAGLAFFWDGERLGPVSWRLAERILEDMSRVPA